MGYTHYWTPTDKKLEGEHLAAMRSMLLVGFKSSEVDNDQDGGAPLVDGDRVWFNGTDAYETFVWERGGAWTFCKTARRPYDRYVCAALLILLDGGYLSSLSSDGMAKGWSEEYRTKPCDEEWNAGAELASRFFPKMTVERMHKIAYGEEGGGE